MTKMPNDLTGQRFGSLTVLGRGESYRIQTLYPDGGKRWITKTRYICRCDCGKETLVIRGNLIAGNTRGCGCKRREQMGNIAMIRWHGREHG